MALYPSRKGDPSVAVPLGFEPTRQWTASKDRAPDPVHAGGSSLRQIQTVLQYLNISESEDFALHSSGRNAESHFLSIGAEEKSGLFVWPRQPASAEAPPHEITPRIEHERAAFETCGVTTNGRAGGEWRVVSQTDINDDDSPEYVLQRASARNWHWVLVDSEGHILRIAGDVRCADAD